MISSFLKQTEGNVTIVVISGNNEELKSSLYSHYPPIPGCETKNARFFASHGMSYASKSVKKQVAYGMLLYRNESARTAMLQAQQENAFPNVAEDIYQLITTYDRGEL